MSIDPGDTFDRYTIEAMIGQGGMGRVYRARDDRLRRRVALKLLRPGGADDRSVAVARVLREARAAAALDHPGSVAIFDVGEVDGIPFIAMEYVVGRPLRALVSDGAVPLAQRLQWLREIARVLAVAHAAGLVHRDIKPENVMVRSDGAVKVLDFGIARWHDDDDDEGPAARQDCGATTLEDSEVCGTPSYMAPEQVQGRAVDARADQFAWGVLAYELLSGALPWQSPSDGVTTRVAVVTERQAALSPLLGVPPRIAAAIDRALEKDPDRRFATMSELVAALDPGPRRRTPGRADVAADGDSFVGRDAELARLRKWLEGGARLVTIVGPPGAGKSRLAREAFARDLAPAFAGRAWCVELGEAETPADIVHATTRALGVSLSLEVGAAATVEPLAALLAGLGRTALVLDGADRFAGAAAIGRLLERAPGLVVVATSRARLLLRGEHVLELGPLALPAVGDPGACEAVALFVDRARAVRPGWRVDADELATVAELVRRLDGLPLAIELAAARMTVLDVPGLLARLDRGGALRRRDETGADAAIEASWALLEPTERAALAQCSVFRGGFDLDAAEAVLDLDADVLDVLARLRDRSLVAARESDGDGRLRLFLYLTIRAFAAGKLDAAARREAERRHARWYATRTQVLADAARETGGAAALAALALERDNLRAIRGRLADDPADAEALALASLALDPLEHAEGSLAEHLHALERALANPATPTQLHPRLRLARARASLAIGRADEALTTLAADVEPEALLVQARAHASLGARSHAQRLAVAARTRATRQPAVVGRADLLLGTLARDAGRIGEAAALLRRARRGLHAAGARVDEGQAALELALADAALGSAEDSARAVADALALLADAADPRWLAAARSGSAALALELGRGAEARAAAEETLAEQRRLGDGAGEATTLGRLAAIDLDDDDPERAGQHTAAALSRTRDPRPQSWLLWIAAVAAWDRGDESARSHARQGLERARAIHDRLTEGLLAATLGAIEASRGRSTEAAQAFDEARRAHAALDDPDADLDVLAVDLDADRITARPVDLEAAALAPAFDDLRRAQDLAARSHRDAHGHLALARDRLARVLAGDPPLVRRSFVVRTLARRLARSLSPPDRALAWAEALDPDRTALVVDIASGLRLPGATAWIDLGGRRRLLRLLAALVEHRGPQPAATLAELLWPDDEASADAVAREVAALRATGLGERVLGDAGGYAFDPTLPVLTIPRSP